MARKLSICDLLPVQVINPGGQSPIVLVCEHASAFIPGALNNLGLPEQALDGHSVWDPGALALAECMAGALDATLVAGTVSRLIYDCNRPPQAPDAILPRSDTMDIPGNMNLSRAERQARVDRVYTPFRETLTRVVARTDTPILVTLHSFTPIWQHEVRDTEVGILHDSDTRLADAMLAGASAHSGLRVRRNDPYGPGDGVTHTLKVHALPFGHRNVMIEIRNDLLATVDDQRAMADLLTGWVTDAIARTDGMACTL